MHAVLLALLLCLGTLLPAHADTALIGAHESGRSLNAHVELLMDPGAELKVTDLQRPEVQARFQPAQGKASVGQSPHPWWVRVTLQRASDAPSRWWLEVGSVTLKDLRIYLPDGNGGWTERQSGELVGFHEGRDHAYRRMLFRLPELSDQRPLTFYLRSYDPAGNSFPLKVWQLDALQEQAVGENLFLGLIYGLILAMLLYNLFIFLSLRDTAYFWYVMTTSGALLMILGMTGHGFQYLWPNGPVPFWLDRISIPALWGFSACRFTQTLLQTRRFVPWAHRLLTFALCLYVTAVLLNIFGLRAFGAWVFVALALTAIPASLWASFRRWRQGYFPALLYLCGFGVILGSVNLLLLRATGVIQPAAWSGYVFPLAVAAESILFSFALASRIQILKQERAAALEHADREKSARLKQVQASAEQLSLAVEARTAELAQANRDLSEREIELKQAAFHDPLTELPNRRYLIERVEAAIAEAARRGESIALLLIDLDHFKPINDGHGHDAGDLLLRTLGQRLRGLVRSSDMAARLGGDEFAILLTGATVEQDAGQVAERLLHELSLPVPYRGTSLAVTVSVGAAFFPHHAEEFSRLYKAADEALYRAKQQGRASWVQQDGRAPADQPI
ncbi:DeoR faimly transcriptional regulator [Stutzerimonas stutzeri]|uniref:diguanylate cyclase domain-containing protein n=1 Tax=Stutzerimonas stutzeri TaxID=316 RepID=UPI0006AC53C1|nr:diguanylate cyclase [Stutzerimonas stutzeri]KOR08044.1 DeoR faimly transcriptional regulator [Stutzerimonas stutzeri]